MERGIKRPFHVDHFYLSPSQRQVKQRKWKNEYAAAAENLPVQETFATVLGEIMTSVLQPSDHG